jgi:hypothetical protein
VLVNNAGIQSAQLGMPFMNQSRPDWQRTFAVNVVGTFHAAKAVAPAMLERGSGAIVNVASVSGRTGFQTDPAYSASKAAVLNFTQAMARDLAPAVRVNAVCPGMVFTPFYAAQHAAALAQGATTVASPEEFFAEKAGRLIPAQARPAARGHRARGPVPGLRPRRLDHGPGPQRGRRPRHVVAARAPGGSAAGVALVVPEHELVVAAHDLEERRAGELGVGGLDRLDELAVRLEALLQRVGAALRPRRTRSPCSPHHQPQLLESLAEEAVAGGLGDPEVQLDVGLGVARAVVDAASIRARQSFSRLMCSGAPRSAGHGHELELEELSRFDDLLDLTPSQDLPGGGDGHRVGAVADEGAAAGAGLDEPLGDRAC